nr:PAS domain-containing sensor histidine kinase [Variovorax boronicumulans]
MLSGPEHCFDYVNDAYQQLAGSRVLLGRPVRAVFPELAGQGIFEMLDRVYATGEPIRASALPVRLAHTPGKRFVDLLYQPIRDAAGRVHGIFAGGYDVTERVDAETELRQLNATLEERVAERTLARERAWQTLAETQDALRQAQKMEAVGQLTGGIAHDFNNLLAAISGAHQLMRLRLDQGQTQGLHAYLDMGERSVRRAASLTQRLLAFSRRQTLDPRPTDVNRLVLGMEEMVARTVGPAVQLTVAPAAAPWPTRVDASQLENALLNLCINARDAMPEGGRLELSTANRTLGEHGAAAQELPAGDYVCLRVTDTGTGMSQDIVQRVFDPFFTTKPLGQGTGLGLSMVYGFVRQSGGQIQVDSEPGRGTTMTLLLPRHGGDAEHDEAGQASDAPDRGSGATLLLIEDEDVVRTLLVEVLEDAGYTVLSAADGPAGLLRLQAAGPMDLLVTDVGLRGGMNGRQVADAGRLLRPDLQVLFITGYAEAATVGNGFMEAGMELMTKPFDLATLVTRVREMLDRRRT